MPPAVLATLGSVQEHSINGAEVWWIAKALEIWGPRLQSQYLLCFADNMAAVRGCIKGYSRSPQVASMVGVVHELLYKYDVRAWFEYVHSGSNPLDSASREGGEAALAAAGATVLAVSPRLEVDVGVYHPFGHKANSRD